MNSLEEVNKFAKMVLVALACPLLMPLVVKEQEDD